MKTVVLNNGIQMPIIGLGTFRSAPDDAYSATLEAIKAGYRHIDTAAVYGNEEAVGRAIKDSGIDRSELFVTTKVWNTEQGYEKTLKACEDSLARLGLEYLDLYLIHWFKGYENSLSTYRALEELYRLGKVRSIGVSNYNVHHLQHLLDNVEIKPMVNQVETHIFLQNHFLNDFCKANDIQLEAYAPLMSKSIEELLGNETLVKIANKHGKTIPQITLRWFVERNIVAIPKSVNAERIKANYEVFDFELDEEDMMAIRQLNRGRKFFPEFDNVEF